jgi:hypothetical protein
MLALRMLPQLESRKGAGSVLILYPSGWVADTIALRPFIAELEALLRASSGGLTVELPPFSDGEDFVHGQAYWNGASLGVYFEYALGYLQFESSNRECLAALSCALEPHIRVAEELTPRAPRRE